MRTVNRERNDGFLGHLVSAPGPELPFLEVAAHFAHPGSHAVFSDSSGRCSLEGGRREGPAPSLPWSLALKPAKPPGV